MNNNIKIKNVRYPSLKKCGVCERVKDIFFRIIIKDFENEEFEVGNINACKQCGENLNKILGNKEKLGEQVVKEFNFNQND